MRTETLADIMSWTRTLHHDLAQSLAQCAASEQEERLRMLLDYLSHHEQELERVLTMSLADAQQKALDTWCYDYFEQHGYPQLDVCQQHLSPLDGPAVLSQVLAVHEKLIELYRYLTERAEIPEVEALVASLLSLEQHEAMRLARDAGRFEDL